MRTTSLSRARKGLRATLSLALVGGVVIGAAALRATGPAGADTSPPVPLPATVSADGLPTVQINGVVWAQVTVGNTVYATGSFTTARPAGVALGGAGSVARSNLLAYDITTGALITSFNHALNAQGRAIAASPDGSTIYVGGDFTTVDGVTHNHIVAIATGSGAVVSSFTTSINNTVQALAVSPTTVYAGGTFSTVNGVGRSALAAVNPAGALLGWNPGANYGVNALTLTPDGSRLIAGGQFSTLAGVTALGMGSVDATTGASEPWAATAVIKDFYPAAILSLTADATQVYGAGYFGNKNGNFEGRFAANPTTGQIVWLNNCHGDTYSVIALSGVLYSAGHEHDCSDIGSFTQDAVNTFSATHHFLAAEQTTPNGGVDRHPLFNSGHGGFSPTYGDFAGQPIANQLDWYPTLTEGTASGQSQAAWSVSGNATYLAVGGEFPTVNGVGQQGLVRFAVAAKAPNKIGPTADSSLTPRVYSQSTGTARVAWQATWDRDNTTLTYSLYRDGGSTPIYTTTVNSTFWIRPDIGFLDTGLANGNHSYQVSVRDPYGNSITSSAATVTVGPVAATSGYVSRVLADGATHFWALSGPTGSSTVADRAGYSDLMLTGTTSADANGPIAGGPGATAFGGGETTPAPTGPGPSPLPVPNDTAGTTGTIAPGGAFSLEGWFKTTSTQGGAIVSLGAYRNNDSPGTATDKVVYLDAAGHLYFGVQNNTAVQTISSASTYNDGTWHLLDATFAGSSARLYVDGSLIGTSDSMTDGIAFNGYWRVGGDNLFGWTAAPAANYLAGSIADVAVYPTALPGSAVAAHYTIGTGATVITNTPPTAAFTGACTALACSTDGTSSTDSDGSIVSYRWTFGDGATATGATASHTYATSGTYPITLTVVDNGGASASVTHAVTVTAAVVTPTAIVSDLFARTVKGGFGTAAPSGGLWTSSDVVGDLSVQGGSAAIALAAGDHAGAYLANLQIPAAQLTTSVAFSALPPRQ